MSSRSMVSSYVSYCWHGLTRADVCPLACRTSRGLHFWEVVPLEVLLEQLVGTGAAAPGSSSVAQKLHQLLVPSYFPNPQEGAVSAPAGHLCTGAAVLNRSSTYTALDDMRAFS
jgi:hypothetical protein